MRAGLASGHDPAVDVLFLLAAERALQQGRFREAVLFCWSTIDSVFNRKYDALVNVALAQEWAEARDFFKRFDMSPPREDERRMWFVAGRSLFREPRDFWTRLSTSYNKRNNIIHRGENATEDEARGVIAVAWQVVHVMNAIPAPPGAI